MTSTIKSPAVASLMLTLMAGSFAGGAQAQGWGKTGGIGQQVARAMSSGGIRGGRTQPSGSGTGGQVAGSQGQNGLQFGGKSAVSVAVGPGGVGVAVATDDSAVAVAVGGGGVGVGVAKDNGKAVSVGVGSDGVSVGAARSSPPVQSLQSSAAQPQSLRRSGGSQVATAVGPKALSGAGGYWNFGRN